MALTKRDFALGMAPVLAVWHKEKPPQETLAVYYGLLAHIPAPLFRWAGGRVLLDKTFGFPKPNDFVEAAVHGIMIEQDASESWARQQLDDYREQYLQLEAASSARRESTAKPLQLEQP